MSTALIHPIVSHWLIGIALGTAAPISAVRFAAFMGCCRWGALAYASSQGLITSANLGRQSRGANEKYPNLVYGRDLSGGGRVGLGGHIIAYFDAVVEVHAIDDFGQVGEAVEFAPMTFGSLDEFEHQWHDGFA